MIGLKFGGAGFTESKLVLVCRARVGVVLALDSPFMKGILDSVEFLQRNRQLTGTAIAIIGFLLMALS